MDKEHAMAAGAMALFGEKYGDRVRVVTMDPHFSIELCGGTHVNNTGEMGLFKIKHESAIAAGVRRIEAVGGSAALEAINTEVATLEQIRTALKNPAEVLRAVQQLQLENTELKKKLEGYEAKLLHQLIPVLLQQTESIGSTSFLGAVIEVSQADALKKICFQLKGHLSDYLVVLTANIDGKAQVAIMIDETTAAAKNLDAGKLIKQEVAPLIKGGGGGAPAGGAAPVSPVGAEQLAETGDARRSPLNHRLERAGVRHVDAIAGTEARRAAIGRDGDGPLAGEDLADPVGPAHRPFRGPDRGHGRRRPDLHAAAALEEEARDALEQPQP
jgi:alanyl-tRNA synthetase